MGPTSIVMAPLAARRLGETFGLVEGQVPGVGGDELAAGVRLVRLDATGAEQDPDSLAAQVLDAAPERGAGGERGIDEGKNDDRHAQAGGLGENAEGVGVADALCPLVDRIVSGRGDDDRVRRLRPGLAWVAVLAADRTAGLGFDRSDVEEGERGRRRHNLDTPASFECELDELADLGSGTGAAHNDTQHAGGQRHRATPIRWAKSSA